MLTSRATFKRGPGSRDADPGTARTMGNRSSSDITVEAYDFDEIQVGDDDDRQAMLHNSPPPSPMASLSVQAVNAAIARGVATVEPPDDQNIPDHVDEEAFVPSQYERGM